MSVEITELAGKHKQAIIWHNQNALSVRTMDDDLIEINQAGQRLIIDNSSVKNFCKALKEVSQK